MKTAKLIGVGILLLIATVVTFALFEVKTVRGNEAGVKETWAGGVETNVYQPKTYFLFPGYSQEIYTYDMSAQVTDLENYRVQSAEGQDLTIRAKIQWRRDPFKLVEQHRNVREKIAEKIITPVMMRVIKDESTAKKAIEQYSGDGLVALQAGIQRKLSSPDGELSQKGVIVENFVIVHIDLDPAYITEIKGKQIATQRQLRAIEETKAADAEAQVTKAKAQADAFKQTVEAERDAQVMVTKAKAANQQEILQAEAQKQKSILEADGKKQAQIALAEGILATGKAEAEAQRLKLQAYSVSGADGYVKVQVAQSFATAFANVRYFPPNMNLSVLSGDFDKAIGITGDGAPPTVLLPTRK
jgi:regulator of protease activity HflC (stomatin/prohibitin superfamily)